MLSGCAQLRTQLSRSDAPQVDVEVERQFNLARLSERQGKLPQAREVYEAILASQPEHVDAQHRLGVVMAKQGLWAESLTLLEQASKVDASGEILADLGIVQYNLGDFQLAEETLRQASLQLPNDARVLNNLGLALGIQGKFDDSLAAFKLASQNDAEAIANLAYVRTQLGDYESALQDYDSALSLDNDLKVAARALVQLDGLQRARAVHEVPAKSIDTALAQTQSATYEGSAPRRKLPAELISPEATTAHISAKVEEKNTERREVATVPSAIARTTDQHHQPTHQLVSHTEENSPALTSPRPIDELGASWSAGSSNTWQPAIFFQSENISAEPSDGISE